MHLIFFFQLIKVIKIITVTDIFSFNKSLNHTKCGDFYYGVLTLIIIFFHLIRPTPRGIHPETLLTELHTYHDPNIY